ncbi:SRPBCC family protein [Rhodocytophaga aerolata]|uniref:SRPBCC family protein n=1 Tax=Rhodocytophaga aerolata TaxID=455078 RepID=A0ABT8RB22_9BACT|nr:SRPBCC family protein [Rhodocytophaga aerolata]MDO1447910.1 SRPBCC family protein [Rhodocytophaga aerolata]
MAVIELDTLINAPIERCFLLSLSVDVHTLSTAHTQERAVAGIMSGRMKLGDTVTWRARHFGIWQQLTSKITAYQYPTYFCDEMISGAFQSFRHEHHFIQQLAGTRMKDVFYFESPLGLLGKLANGLFLKSYMSTLLAQRNLVIKKVAEGNEWKKFT